MDSDIHRVDVLVKKLPDPGDDCREQVLAGWTSNGLVDLGQRFDTDEILIGAGRFVAVLADRPPTASQRKVLIGYSPEKFALLVHEVARLRELNKRFDARAARGIAAARDEVRTAMTKGVALRDIVERTLEGLVPQDTALRSALAEAHGLADSPSSLTESLRDLAGVVRALRDQSSAVRRERLDSWGVDDALIEQLHARADAIDDKQANVVGKSGTRATQRDLDYQDGVVLVLIHQLHRTFQYGRALNARIVDPPLTGALRRLVNRAKAKGASAEPPIPVEPPPVPAPEKTEP